MVNINDDEQVKGLVIKGYRHILKRDPDPEGLANYIGEIKRGLCIERFYEILRTSEEYIRKFDISEQNSSPVIVLTYCMMGLNSLHEIRPYIETALPYVDRFIFIDGGSTDGTVEYLQSLNSKYGNKVEVYIHKWQDSFPGQRNNYLKHFSEKQNDGWILVSDTDEHFTQDALSKLVHTIKDAEHEGYNGIKILAYDIIIDDNDPKKILSEHVSNSNFHKPIIFKYHPDIHYKGGVHEILDGPIMWKEVDLMYQHIRSQKKIYERAVQNFWDSSINTRKWQDFRLLCVENGILRFNDFFELYKNGTLPKDVERWIYDHKDYNEDQQYLHILELRDTIKLYFEILHPDKKIEINSIQ